MEAVKDISFILYTGMSCDPLDDYCFVCLGSIQNQLHALFKCSNPTPETHLANQTVSWISLVIVYTPNLPRRTCPIRKSGVDMVEERRG